ncbi:MAG TPA: TonB-dependent receptor plug domain-containing protein, partial [Opitutus sp.]|nr:TonB-dependent receptor plug domain-containing protein [Opitutus sp.]
MNQNQDRNRLCRLLCGAALAFAATTSHVMAQTTSSSNAGNSEDDIVLLSPFSVTGEDDEGYRATTTLAGTRIKTELRDVGSAITVVTDQFLKDTAVTGNEELLLYTPSTEVGGLNGNFSGGTRVRGLGAADNARDFFLSDIPWDSYNVDRIDLQRGPNSILFGLGKPSGLVNASLKTAGYKNENSVEARVGSFGSFRGVLNLNRVLLPNELAIRFDAVKDHTKYRQEPAYGESRRMFGALRYDPMFLRKGSAHTTLRASYEKGLGHGNAPLTTPPIDAITPWFKTGTTTTPDGRVFNNLNQGTFDWRYNTVYLP